jgi:hypothetical protein
MEFKFFHHNQKDKTLLGILWRDNRGRITPVQWLTRVHIHNIINCLNGTGEMTIPNPYMGRYHHEWLNIFNSELNLRDAEGC